MWRKAEGACFRRTHGCLRSDSCAWGAASGAVRGLCVVAPDAREADVRARFSRPAFRHARDINMRFIPYGELAAHRDAMARFGEGLKAIEAVSRELR